MIYGAQLGSEKLSYPPRCLNRQQLDLQNGVEDPQTLPDSGIPSSIREYLEEEFDEYTAPELLKSISLSKCPVFPANALSFNLFMWSKVMLLKLPAEENKMSIPDMTVSIANLCTSAGRRRGHIRVTKYQKHGERKHNPCRSCTITRASEQP